MKNKKKVIIGILIVLVIAAVVYFVVIKKSDDDMRGLNEKKIITVKDKTETPDFNIILDTNGNAYLGLKKDSAHQIDNKNLLKMFEDAFLYSYDNQEEKLIKLNLPDINVRNIGSLRYGNAGWNYIILIDNNSKLYLLYEDKIINDADMRLWTDKKLDNVQRVNTVCYEDGCKASAYVVIDKQNYEVFFDDLFK